MHKYGSDFTYRGIAHLLLGAIALLLSLLFHHLTSGIADRIDFEQLKYLGISYFTIFFLIERIFDTRALPLVSRLLGVTNLQGEWSGEIITNKDNELYATNIRIMQTLSEMRIEFETDTMDSVSIGASIGPKPFSNGQTQLAYTYMASSKDSALNKLNHFGTSILNYDKASNTLKGEYFTERPSSGKLRLQRIDEKSTDINKLHLIALGFFLWGVSYVLSHTLSGTVIAANQTWWVKIPSTIIAAVVVIWFWDKTYFLSDAILQGLVWLTLTSICDYLFISRNLVEPMSYYNSETWHYYFVVFLLPLFFWLMIGRPLRKEI